MPRFRPVRLPSIVTGNSSSPSGQATADGHLLFVWKPSGYELVARGGEPPAPGEAVEHAEARLVVAKVGASPLPGDPRPCAYLGEA